MDMTTNATAAHALCSCGESAPHVIARRHTDDGVAVEFWHDGAITGRLGLKLPGVPVARPRTAAAVALARATAALVAGEVELCDVADLPRLVACARRVAARGGLPGDVRAAFHATETTIRLAWEIYSTDRDGAPAVRVARLDRIRWPGLAVWHERGRYEVMTITRGTALGARSNEALTPTGIVFDSQRDLCVYLAAESRFSARPGVAERPSCA